MDEVLSKLLRIRCTRHSFTSAVSLRMESWGAYQSAASFPDFLSDQGRCKDPRWYIEEPAHHRDLANGCFRIMREAGRNGMGMKAWEQILRPRWTPSPPPNAANAITSLHVLGAGICTATRAVNVREGVMYPEQDAQGESVWNAYVDLE
jgi:hypothetical protein